MQRNARRELALLATLYRVFAVATALFLIPAVLTIYNSLYYGAGAGVPLLCDPATGRVRELVVGSWTAVVLLAGLAFAAVMFSAGRLFEQQRAYASCKVVALLACVALPVGTALGLYTLAVLSRPAVRQAYGMTTMA